MSSIYFDSAECTNKIAVPNLHESRHPPLARRLDFRRIREKGKCANRRIIESVKPRHLISWEAAEN